jgi:hypothetical protein
VVPLPSALADSLHINMNGLQLSPDQKRVRSQSSKRRTLVYAAASKISAQVAGASHAVAAPHTAQHAGFHVAHDTQIGDHHNAEGAVRLHSPDPLRPSLLNGLFGSAKPADADSDTDVFDGSSVHPLGPSHLAQAQEFSSDNDDEEYERWLSQSHRPFFPNQATSYRESSTDEPETASLHLNRSVNMDALALPSELMVATTGRNNHGKPVRHFSHTEATGKLRTNPNRRASITQAFAEKAAAGNLEYVAEPRQLSTADASALSSSQPAVSGRFTPDARFWLTLITDRLLKLYPQL